MISLLRKIRTRFPRFSSAGFFNILQNQFPETLHDSWHKWTGQPLRQPAVCFPVLLSQEVWWQGPSLWDLFRTIWSRCRDVILGGRTIELGKPLGVGKGMGRSVCKQPWTRVDEDRTTQCGGIPSKKRDSGETGVSRGISKGNWQGESTRGYAMAQYRRSVYMYHNIVWMELIKELCLGYK
jgi:hypothetical protein